MSNEASIDRWSFFWRNALVAECRRQDARAFTGKNKLRFAMQGADPSLGGALQFHNGVMVLVDQPREVAVLAAFPVWSSPTRLSRSEAERSALKARARSAAKENSVELKELTGPNGRSEIVYVRELSMPETAILVGNGSDFTSEGTRQIENFAHAVSSAASIFFADDADSMSAYFDALDDAIMRQAQAKGSQTPSPSATGSQASSPSPSSKSSSGCFVATAVYGSYDCPQVCVLRRWRDSALIPTKFGRALVRVYYAISPHLVRAMGRKAWFVKLAKIPLDRLVMRLMQSGIPNGRYQDVSEKAHPSDTSGDDVAETGQQYPKGLTVSGTIRERERPVRSGRADGSVRRGGAQAMV